MRAPDLRALHRRLAALAGPGAGPRACAVIVPTRGAAEELRRTIEHAAFAEPAAAAQALVLPDLLTRADFYLELHARLPGAPPLLTGFEREVLFRRAARTASDAGAPAPFHLRAGLVVEILACYDELRRRDRTIDDFDRLMIQSLAPSAETDRGAERMLRQTRFLSSAFAEFERRVAGCGRIDEHGLRAMLLETPVQPAYAHVVVTVGDQAADPRGLWAADFDLLSRMPGVSRVDVIATEAVLAAGLHERVHDLLPQIEEVRIEGDGAPPVLVVPEPPQGAALQPWFVCRDREEELVEVARWIKGPGRRRPEPDRTAVVFQRPLPYLYLARQVFGSSRIPYQALDALPLAAEPFAAALDLVFSFARAEGSRGSLVELLASPLWSFLDPEGERAAVEPRDVAAVDRLLRELKYLGGWDRLAGLATQSAEPAGAVGADGAGRAAASRGRRAALWRQAAPALRAAAAAAAELREALDAPAASRQLAGLRAFITGHERLPRAADPWQARHLRARGAILAALDALADAHARHDDEALPLAALSGTIRRWIEGQTFSPRTGSSGVSLLDAPAAAFADADVVRIVGLVETDWPERPRRNIFYPASLLSQLGWPSEVDRIAAARARFRDLLALPRQAISVSTFTLEDDAIVSPSPFLEEVTGAGLALERAAGGRPARIFAHEALADAPLAPAAVAGEAAAWLAVRRLRTPADAEAYRGSAGPRAPAAYAVSSVERYLECPFKYFAGQVLKLEEEREDESGLTPQERGQVLHAVFEAFFREWHAAGGGAIRTENLDAALALFEEVAGRTLEALPEADRALERTYLLGSAAAPGLAERAFAFEIEHGVDVLERLLEHVLDGAFVFQGADGPRAVTLRGKADRVDLLADGTLRVIDYKLGRAPKNTRALQLPVYGVCAQQQLEGRHGRSWTLGRAGYVAFREKNPFVPLGGAAGSLDKALAEGQQRLVAAVAGIEAGTFPPRPDEPWICTRCGFSTVCRKDYVGDE